MINRTTINNSRFDILNEDQQTIKQYIEAEQKKTPEQKEKELKNRKVTIENVNLQENYNNQDSEPSNNIVVYTRQDNLTHNYFHYFDLYWDAGDCLSSVTLKMPKTDTGNTQYWITYTGEVEIYTGNNINHTTQSTTDENNSSTSQTYWDLQGLSPLFRGEIGRIKEYQEVLEIHIDSIGKRFKQKIPDEFRQSYINNQNVRDAFQAICEFLGVKYICPPAQPKTDEDSESASTDGTENNVNDKNNAELNAAKQVANQVANQAAESNSDKNTNENDKSKTDTNTDDANSANSSSDTDSTVNVDTPQNGYTDISFDSNGSIVHGSVVIETSPDMAETLIELTEHPLDKYLEDTTYVATDVKKFLNGEFFDTVHGNYLSYGSITITPKSASSSNMSTVGGITGDTATSTSGDEADRSDGNSGSGNSSGSSGNGVSGVYGKTAAGSYYLTNEAINKMDIWEARRRYEDGQKRNIYTRATMYKLGLRMYGFPV